MTAGDFAKSKRAVRFSHSLIIKRLQELRRKYRPPHWVLRFVPILVVAVVLSFLAESFSGLSWLDFQVGLTTVSLPSAAIAVLLTSASYLLLSIVEQINLRAIGVKIPWSKAIQISFAANAVSNQLSLAGVSGAGVRFRFLKEEKISAEGLLNLVALNSLSLWAGFSILILSSTAYFGLPKYFFSYAPTWAIHTVLTTCLAFVGVGLLFAIPAVRRKAGMIERIKFPHPGLIYLEFLVSCVDWLISALVLYLLLPTNYDTALGPWIAVFLFGQVSGLLLNLPGGIGVLDALVLAMAGAAPRPEVLGALVMYRIIFYFVPLLLILITLGLNELKTQSPIFYLSTVAAVDSIRRRTAFVIPTVVFIFATGVLVNLDGPSDLGRNILLHGILKNDFTPAPTTIGLVGVLALLTSIGLFYRRRLAWHLTLFCSVAALASIVYFSRDFQYMVWPGSILLGYLWYRPVFNRESQLFNRLRSKQWRWSVAAAIFGLIEVCLNFPTQIRLPTSNLITEALSTPPSVFHLLFYAGVFGLCFTLVYLFAPTSGGDGLRHGFADRRRKPSDFEEIVASSAHTLGQLVFVGDKRTLLSRDKKSFIMFSDRAKSWVAMGDPVGSADHKDLVRDFSLLADRQGRNAVFYQIRADNLSVYVDNGFHIVKIGEEAMLDLKKFDMTSARQKNLRNTYRRVRKAGIEFKVIPPGKFLELESQFREVSDSWLSKVGGTEKDFSVGYYDREYLSRHHHAVLMREGRVVAFANLWRTQDRNELSVDLMRYGSGAPSGSMDFLFLCLIRYGQENGYRWFNLGMAPLSGLEYHLSSPLWNLVASFIFENGERIYKFRGIRNFKEKYEPTWQPRYIAYRSQLGLLGSVLGIIRLISKPRTLGSLSYSREVSGSLVAQSSASAQVAGARSARSES